MGGAVVCRAFVKAGPGAFYVLGRRYEEYGRIFLGNSGRAGQPVDALPERSFQ
jgi:hypothetical protein